MDADRTRSRQRLLRGTVTLVVLVIALAGAACTTKKLETTNTTVSTSSTASTSSTSTTARPGTTGTSGGGGTTTSVIPISWSLNALEYRGENGRRVSVECEPGGVPYSVWGTDTYTDDSSICTAAVHQGIVTFESGGVAEIEIAPGRQEYEGSTANGVTSSPYGPWEGSFTFVE
jgi:hypothetical protein